MTAIIISCVAALTAMFYANERIKELSENIVPALEVMAKHIEDDQKVVPAIQAVEASCTFLASGLQKELIEVREQNKKLKERVDLLEKIIRSTDADEVWKKTVQEQ